MFKKSKPCGWRLKNTQVKVKYLFVHAVKCCTIVLELEVPWLEKFATITLTFLLCVPECEKVPKLNFLVTHLQNTS